MAVVTYKCPNCDGGLVFEPGSQKFTCDYCGSSFTEEEVRALDPARQSAQAAGEAREAPDRDRSGQQQEAEPQAVLYSCPSCGAQVVTDDTTAATFCYFCHNPVVLEARLQGEFAPDQVIPFAVDREKAVQSFLDWVGKKKFVPRAFFSQDQIEKLTGVYFPYWMADLDVRGSLNTTGTKVRVWRAGNYEYTETSRFQLVRDGSFRFPELTRNALNSKYNRQLVDGVLPFRTGELRDFQMSFLSGFQAEQRNMERGDVEQDVCEEARDYTRKLLQDTAAGYTLVDTSSLQAEVSASDWRYVLLPVWVLTYKGTGGKTYYYAMNGQTGKVCGQLPVDGKRLGALFAGVTVPLFLLLLLGGWLL